MRTKAATGRSQPPAVMRPPRGPSSGGLKTTDSRWNEPKKYWTKPEKWLPIAAFLVTAASATISVALWFAQLGANGINRGILAAGESAAIYFGSATVAARRRAGSPSGWRAIPQRKRSETH